MSGRVRVGVVMWPVEDWSVMGENWRRAESYGFDTAWIYDHLAWRGHTPWDEAYTSLAAAAALTSTVRLGTLVTSANFRHPLPTAAQIRTVDRISEGRLRLGVGAGGDTHTSDGDVLGRVWTPRERADRFEEYVTQLDALLTTSPVSTSGTHFTTSDVSVSDGLVQQRPPFLVAGNGPRGMRLAARHGQGWIANPQVPAGGDPYEEVAATIKRLSRVCEAEGRDVADLEKVLLTGFTGEPWLDSLGAFQDLLGRYEALGFTDIAVHWPRPGTEWAADWDVFEEIAAYAAASRRPGEQANGDAKIVTLCGSTRFEAEFAKVNQRLTLAGCVVISLGTFGIDDLPVSASGVDRSALLARLGELHFQKIRMADEVYVVDPGGYVGDSTRREIAYAESLGKPVRYLSREGRGA